MDGKKKLEELVGKIARAWASIDGKTELFDKENGCTRYGTGTYEGYMAEAEELLRRSGLSDAYKAMEAERDELYAALQAIMSNHETAGAGASIFQCTTAEVNAARRALATTGQAFEDTK